MHTITLVSIVSAIIGINNGFLIPDGIQKVTTKVGDIIGFTDQVTLGDQHTQVRKFLGIPYAEPPVGSLRFKKPVMKTTLPTSQFKAQSYGSKCPQPFLPANDTTSEDCLFLNIFTPATTDPASTKPVMVWIHGGGFLVGYSDVYEADVLSGIGDVIVVTINYRVGILGFFSTEDGTAKGNFGLWDQHLAIRWVHENIANFGGDPNSITIFGESAGSSSVIYQMLYPGNKGLVKRAIAESGTIASWAVSHGKTNTDFSIKFAQTLGCNNLTEMVSCLRNKPEAAVVSATLKFENGPSSFDDVNRTWVPKFDNEFVFAKTPDILSELSDEALRMKKYPQFLDIDLLIGANNYDGVVYQDLTMRILNNTTPTSIVYKVSQNQFKTIIVPRALESWLDDKPTQLAIDLTVTEYTYWDDPLNATMLYKNSLDIWTDYALNAPMISTANAHTNVNTSTYLYQFSITPPKRLLPIAPVLEGRDVACHADELPFVFGFTKNLKQYWNMSDDSIKSNDYRLSKEIMTMWANFAKSGNPNLPEKLTTLNGASWPQYDASGEKYIEMLSQGTEVKQRLRAEQVQFWNSLLPEMQAFARNKS